MNTVLQRQLGAALAAGVCVGLAACALRGRNGSARAGDEKALPKLPDEYTSAALVTRANMAEPTAAKAAIEDAKKEATDTEIPMSPANMAEPTAAKAPIEDAENEATDTEIPMSPAVTCADEDTQPSESSSDVPIITRPALLLSPTAEAAAEAEAVAETTAGVMPGGAMIPDSVRTVDLFEEVESRQVYQHGTPAPLERSAETQAQPDTLADLTLPPYKLSTVGIYQPNSVNPYLDVSVSSMNDSSFTAGAKQSFLDGIISGSEEEDEQPPQNQSEVADKEDIPVSAARSPGVVDASFQWPPSNGWGTPDPPSAATGARPHLSGGTPKPLGDQSCATNVKQLLYERGAAIDAAIEASAAGKFRNVAEVLVSSTSEADFRHVLAAVQEQQRAKASELKQRQQTLQAMQQKNTSQRKNQEQAADQFQQQLASMLSEARNNAKWPVVTETAFRDLPEFPEEESDDDEYHPTATDLAADAADAATNGLDGTVPELPVRRAPVVQTKPTWQGGKRPNKKRARKRTQADAAPAAPTKCGAGKENRVTLTTATGKSVTAGKRATWQGQRLRARNQLNS
jgi:hypothetical protein